MLLKKTKQTFFIILLILILSLITTYIHYTFWSLPSTFSFYYLDHLFFLAFFVFIIGSFMLMNEGGLLNVFLYSTHKVRSVVSSKYQFTLLESEHIKKEDMDTFLKNKYLYKRSTYAYTLPIFLSSTLILIGLLVYAILFLDF